MIESNIVVPSVLPDFEVPESAPNYWQELAAYTWIATLKAMSDDGQKVRQEDLIAGHSVEMAVHDLLLPWLLEDGENESFLLGEMGYASMSLQEIKNELENLTTSTSTVKDSVDTVKTSMDAVKTSVDAVAYHTDAISRKNGLNAETPNLIDDFFSGIVVDSDAIKVAIVAIQSILEGGNLVLDLVAEAIKEQVTATEENVEVLQEISDRLFNSESEKSITETLTVAGEKLFIPASDTEPERSVTEVLQGLSVMPNNLTLHVSNLNTKESQDYTERWSAT